MIVDDIEKIKKHAFNQKDIDESIVHAYLIKSNEDIYGVLYVNKAINHIDNHCEQCKTEQLLFLKFAEYEDYPKTIASEIGTEKLERYKDNMEEILPNYVSIIEQIY